MTSKDGYISTYGGRMLKINPEWKNPTNSYRYGVIKLFDLFPKVITLFYVLIQ